MFGALVTVAGFTWSFWLLGHLDSQCGGDRAKSSIPWFLCQQVLCTVVELLCIDFKYEVLNHLDKDAVDLVYEQSLHLPYCLTIGIWLSVLVEALLMRRDEVDSTVMLIHHFATLALLLISAYLEFRAFGILVLFLHDASDLSVTMTKLLAKTDARQDMVVTSYVIMMASWIYFRLYWF